MEEVVEKLKETVKIQAAKIELLEETLKEQRDRMKKLEAKQRFPSRNFNLENLNPVVRLVRLRELPNQGCTSEDAVTVVPTNETRAESLATSEKRKVSKADRSETLDLDKEIAGKKKTNTRDAEPGRAALAGTSTKPCRTEDHTSVKNKQCATTQLRRIVLRQPERVSTMPNSGRGKSNSSGVERPKCTFCSKTFVTVQTLSLHIRSHTGEKPFKCQTCRRAFASSSDLSRHIRTHTGEKPFECNVCGRSFAQVQNLIVHTRTHTGEKPFQCNVCQKSFAQTNSLTVHTRTHTGEKPFQCNVCQKSFARTNSLTVHTRTHTGEKPFVCNFCNSTFARKFSLDYHIRGHTGEKPHKCKVCGADFKAMLALTTHENKCLRRLL